MKLHSLEEREVGSFLSFRGFPFTLFSQEFLVLELPLLHQPAKYVGTYKRVYVSIRLSRNCSFAARLKMYLRAYKLRCYVLHTVRVRSVTDQRAELSFQLGTY